MVVSFPSNPTAQVCDLDFYRDLIAFAKKHHLWVLSDLAYAEIYFDGNPPPSILQVDGARDVAVEFTSLSKTYAMPGWRMGFAVGNTAPDRRADPHQVLPRLRRLHPGPGRGGGGAQRPATTASPRSAASTNPAATCWSTPWPAPAGRIPSPPATMFAWAPVPEPYAAIGSMGFSKILLREAEVAVAPGIGFGEYGEGYVRLGLVENEHRIRQAARGVRQVMQNADALLAKHHAEEAAA